MFTHLLCPIDGSTSWMRVLELGARIAREQGARLTICTVVDPTKAAAMTFGNPAMSGLCLNALHADAQRMVSEVAARLAPIVRARAVTLTGPPIEAIVNYAEENGCDLIVMGSHRRNGIPRALLGSVAEGVLRNADVPVLIAGSHDEARSPAAYRPRIFAASAS